MRAFRSTSSRSSSYLQDLGDVVLEHGRFVAVAVVFERLAASLAQHLDQQLGREMNLVAAPR